MKQNTNPEELALYLNSRPDDLVEIPDVETREENEGPKEDEES